MKFDSNSLVQTEVAKAFSTIWDKLTTLELENKQLRTENEELRRELNRFTQQSSQSNNEHSPQPPNHYNSSQKSEAAALLEDDYTDEQLLSQNQRTNAPLLDKDNSPQPVHTRDTETQHQDEQDNLSFEGLMSPTKLIENDRMVRVKMFGDVLQHGSPQSPTSPQKRTRKQPRTQNNHQQKLSYSMDEAITDEESEATTTRWDHSPRPISKLQLSRQSAASSGTAQQPNATSSPRRPSHPHALKRTFSQNSSSTNQLYNNNSTSDLELPVVKRIVVYRNGDKHHEGESLTLNMNRFSTFKQFVQLLNRKLQMGTPIRKVFRVPDHTRIRKLEDLEDGAQYIAVGGEMQIRTGQRYPNKIRLLREHFAQEEGGVSPREYY